MLEKRSLRRRVIRLQQLVFLVLARLRIHGAGAARDFTAIAVVADLGRRNGIAQGARLQAAAAGRAGFDCQLVDASSGLGFASFAKVPHRRASTYVFHVGAPETATIIHNVLPYARGSWRIGFWAWELPDPPPDWKRFETLVHEIWTPSTFCARSLQELFSIPVRVVPHHVESGVRHKRSKSQGFTVLLMADSRSSLTRKNLRAGVECYRQASEGQERWRLLIKANSREDVERELHGALDAVDNVEVITEFLDDREMDCLYHETDVLLSLHRSEGFGLPLVEAMSRGVPVVATGWSGNIDFMSSANAVLVPYELVASLDDSNVYNYSSRWAEPDIAAAALALRRLCDDEGWYERVSEAAYESMRNGSRFAVPLD